MFFNRSLKLALFIVLDVLFMGVLYVHAATRGDYVADPSLYWWVRVKDVGFSGRDSQSKHKYTVENYSKYDLRVNWEYSHKVMRADGTVYKNASEHDTFNLKAGKYKCGTEGTINVRVTRGKYYISAYTSVDILYEKKRPKIPTRIKYGKTPTIVTEEEEIK